MDYNGLKQSLILQTKQNRLLQISFFFSQEPYLCYLKKIEMYLALYVERLGFEFGTILVTFLCISYFASQICINPTRDTLLVSKKKLTKFVHISSIIPSYLKMSK